MITLLLALTLAQNTNQGPIIVQQNGTTQSGFRANTINCQAGILCAQSGTVMTINALGGDGGTAPTNISGALPVTAISDAGNGFTIGLTVPTCNVSGSALQYSAGVFSCVAIDAGAIKVVTATLPILATSDGGGGVDISFSNYQTTANSTRYLSMTGADTGNCTTTACRTLAYLSTQVPMKIRHTVTISIDAGTYTEPITWIGHDYEPASQSATPFVQFLGAAMTAVTPTTGTASGTLTGVTVSGSIGSPTDYTLFTDGTQVWTADDFIGKWVDIAGTKYIIAGNTATALKIPAYPNPTPSVGAAYSIVSPSVIFNGTTSYGVFIAGNTASQIASIRLMQIQEVTINTTSGYSINNSGNSLPITFTRVRLNSTSNGLEFPNATSGVVPLSAHAFVTSNIGAGPGTFAQCYNCSISSSVVERNLAMYSGTFSGALLSGTGNTALTMLSAPNRSDLGNNVGSVFVRCRGGSQMGAWFQGPNSSPTVAGISSTAIAPPNFYSVANLIVENCTRPLVISGRGDVNMPGRVVLSGDYTNTTNSVALTIQNSATLRATSVPIVSDAGTQISLDGDSFLFEDVRAQSNKIIRNQSTGTAVILQ